MNQSGGGGGPDLTTTPVRSTYEPKDWDNGNDPHGYYSQNLMQSGLILRLLMYGEVSSSKKDIPNGSIYGYTKNGSSPCQASVGLSTPLDANPIDNQ